MQFKIHDGTVVEVEVGSKLLRLQNFQDRPDEGWLTISGLLDPYVLIDIGGDQVAISGDTVSTVDTEPAPAETVTVSVGDIKVKVSPEGAAAILGLQAQVKDPATEVKVKALEALVDSQQSVIDMLKSSISDHVESLLKILGSLK
jgi:hypothetical protein